MTNIIRLSDGPYFTQKVDVIGMDDGLDLHTMQDLIGAECIEVVSPLFLQTLYDPSACLIIDDAGLIKGRQINQLCGHLYGADICGPALIVKRSEEDLVGEGIGEAEMKREETIDKLMRNLGCESLNDDGKNKEREEEMPEVRHVNIGDVVNDMALIMGSTSSINLIGQLFLETEKSGTFQELGKKVSEGMVLVGAGIADIAEKLFGKRVRDEVIKKSEDLSFTLKDIAEKEWLAEIEGVKVNDLN